VVNTLEFPPGLKVFPSKILDYQMLHGTGSRSENAVTFQLKTTRAKVVPFLYPVAALSVLSGLC